jgi:hypothetical protein
MLPAKKTLNGIYNNFVVKEIALNFSGENLSQFCNMPLIF